jgi:uncharacterized protein (TIGR00369 family)
MSKVDLAGLSAHQQGLLEACLEAGYGRWAGVKLVELGEAVARTTFTLREEMLTPWGTVNGGVISSLVEIPSFLAMLPTVADGELPVTNDIFVQHMRPLPGDRAYEMTGRMVRRSRTMAWTDVVVTASGEPVTLARITKTLVKR